MDVDERPWGSIATVDGGPGWQVKRLEVRPGRRLSLQSHRRRSEHWFVAVGVADTVVGDCERQIAAGGSTDIGVGQRHRLGNSQDTALVVVEVQRGDYLGEDDIERYSDDFGRR